MVVTRSDLKYRVWTFKIRNSNDLVLHYVEARRIMKDIGLINEAYSDRRFVVQFELPMRHEELAMMLSPVRILDLRHINV